MQRYTKNSKSAANYNQSLNVNIDSAKKKKSFPSLENFIFFIDVAKKCDYTKLEDKIKSVHGKIRLFLTDDVTHFITDKENDVQNYNSLIGSSSRGSLNCSSPKTPKTPELVDLKPNRISTSRSRSRVDEMIYRARLENNVTQQSLVDVALLKNIRVWDLNFANLYLNKTIKKIKLYKSSINKGINDRIFLTEPYIKIEDCSSKHRPYYKIFKSKWPFVNVINCDLENSKTSKEEIINENNIKINFIKETENNKLDKFGYCELCKCEYDLLSVHLKTEKHFLFASDQQNYETLDKLIDEKISVKFFLEENSASINNLDNSVRTNMTKLQYHDYFSRTANDSEKGLCIQGKINRVTRQGQINIEAKKNGCKNKRNETTRSNNKNSLYTHINLQNHFNYISEVQKNEKETQNYNNEKDSSSLYYKVIKSQSGSGDDLNNKTNHKDDSKPAIIVKFRKIRQSELSVLNGEAENFMFPKTKVEIENSKKEINEQKPNKRKYSNAFSPDEKNNEKVKRNTNTKKKANSSERKSQSKECSNDDYLANFKNLCYSFERIPKTEPWYNVFRRQDSGMEHTFEYFGGTGYKKLPYEMGHISSAQSKSYLNFCTLCKKKEDRTETQPNNISTDFSIRQIEQSIKLENDIAIKKESELRDRYNCNNKLIDNSKFEVSQHNQIEQQNDMNNYQNINQQEQTVNKPFKKYYLMNFDMPRKSPREHASTLAMLSCLIKKSNSCQNSVNNDSKETTPEPLVNINRTITPTLENDHDKRYDSKEYQNQKDLKGDDNKLDNYLKRRSKSFYNERIQKMTSVTLEKEIDYFLTKSYPDCLDYNNPLTYKFRNTVEINKEQNKQVENEKNSNDANLDDILEHSITNDLSHNQPLLLNEDIRITTTQKKRPINKTGWPYKKKLMTRRQKGCITGFHHHKGILVKKTSPWSFMHNNSRIDNDKRDNESNEKVLENSSIIDDAPSNLNIITEKDTKLIENENTNSLRIDDSSRINHNLKIQSENEEDLSSTDLTSQTNLPSPFGPDQAHPKSKSKSPTPLESTPQQTVQKTNLNSIAPPSPRVLRKPRGRWYRER